MSSSPEPQSALNLRTVLAGFGLVLCTVLAALAWVNRDQLPAGAVVAGLFAVGAVLAVVDLVVLRRRRADRRRVDARAGRSESRSLFE